MDEAGFSLIPNAKSTWSPRGVTPHVRFALKRGRVNAVSALVVSPKRRRLNLHAQLFFDTIDAEATMAFLRHLLQRERGILFLFWDNIPFHHDPRVWSFIAHHPRLHVFHFPPYAPELNPDEFVWTQTDEQLAGTLLPDVPHLVEHLCQALQRTRNSQLLLRACINASALPWRC